MKIDIILRTHNKNNVHISKEERYCGSDKTTLICKSVKSLIDSCNKTNYDIQYLWIDDHSTTDCVNAINKLFSESKFEHKFIPLEESGFNASALTQFEYARDSKSDLVYLVEDDYLHFPTAIEEMVEAYALFKRNINSEVAIHPFDDPDNYLPDWIEETRIVYGKKRHWRTNYYSTFTILCNPSIIRKYWSKWYTLATEYGSIWSELQGGNIHEGSTINQIWRKEIPLFTPIPSVALHVQYEAQRDPYLNWKSLWDSITI